MGFVKCTTFYPLSNYDPMVKSIVDDLISCSIVLYPEYAGRIRAWKDARDAVREDCQLNWEEIRGVINNVYLLHCSTV